MSRPKLLDLFCCAGGASMGYHRAGYDVYGVELDGTHLRRYPFPSHQGDVLDVMRRLLAGEAVRFTSPNGTVENLRLSHFDAVAASPPCQHYSITKHSHTKTHPDLIVPTRILLLDTGLPYIIENVAGAPLIDPVTLCGSMFSLRATDTDGLPLRLERHRLFESNRPLAAPGVCFHDKSVRVAGAYGGGSSDRAHAQFVRRGGYTPAKEVRAALLGIDWPMTLQELSQSIPPAYTEWLGLQLIGSQMPVGYQPALF